MADAQHSPGPFLVLHQPGTRELALAQGEVGTLRVLRDAHGFDVAATFGPRSEANARLFAQAAEMRETLIVLRNIIVVASNDTGYLKKNGADVMRELADVADLLARVAGEGVDRG